MDEQEKEQWRTFINAVAASMEATGFALPSASLLAKFSAVMGIRLNRNVRGQNWETLTKELEPIAQEVSRG